MILDVLVDTQEIKIQIPDEMLTQSQAFFDKMDKDLDSGRRLGPTYIENLDAIQRAQIVADRLLTAIETENTGLAQLMAAYIVTRIKNVKLVNIDIDGDPLNTEIILN